MEEKLRRPLGVTILAVLNIISGILLTIMGLITLIILIGVFILPLGIVSLIIGYGLLKGKNWVRIITIIFSIIGIIFSIFYFIEPSLKSIISGLVEIGINGLILYYFTYNEEVKRYFENKNN